MRARPSPATSLHRRAFETINPGQVLVIDARGGAVRWRLRRRARDASGGPWRCRRRHRWRGPRPGSHAGVGLPLFARGVHTASFGQAHIVSDLNIPVQCAGVLIAPGDILVGDPEGVVAIPQAVAAQAAEADPGAGTARHLLAHQRSLPVRA